MKKKKCFQFLIILWAVFLALLNSDNLYSIDFVIFNYFPSQRPIH